MLAGTTLSSAADTLPARLSDETFWQLVVDLSEEVAVAPSIMDTAANHAAMPKADHKAWPKVEEVAATILFLASPEKKVTRGAIVPV